jgi:four helix bundle protein
MAGADRFEHLIAWQRAHELHLEVWTATNRPPARRDLRFRDQIRDASESVERNVAEGFGLFNPGQFAHFLDISRASTLETKTLLKKGLVVGYWNMEEFSRLDSLADRALQSIAKFQRYLRSPQAKRNAEQRYRRNDSNDSSSATGSNDPNASNDR